MGLAQIGDEPVDVGGGVRAGGELAHRDQPACGERDTTTAWQSALPGYQSQILGPHFEHPARLWTARHAGDLWPEPMGEVGPDRGEDLAGRAQHEVDVVALARGRDAATAHLALFGRSGFDRNLLAHAAEHAHLHLITLDDLYQQTPGFAVGSAWR